MTDTPVPRIVIIGGGFAGVLAAIKIIDATSAPLSLDIVERREELGRGIAYSTADIDHIVNGPARLFSLHPGRPDHFTGWLRANTGRRAWAPPQGSDPGDSFPPRLLYGDYVQDELSRALGDAAGRVAFRHVRDTAQDIAPSGAAYLVRLESGQMVRADYIVLATGLHTADRSIAIDPVLRGNGRYVADVWAEGALDGAEAARDILLLGTSLTAIDALITLEKRGFRGTYTAVSRRGLLARRRNEVEPWPAFLNETALPGRITELLRIIRREQRAIIAAGEDWQRLALSLRPFVTPLWLNASEVERSRFTRHLRVFWDVALHRAAAPTAAWVERVQAQGRLRLLKGRVLSLAADGARVSALFRPRGGTAVETLATDYVVNGLGHEFDWRRIADPLVRSLLAQGLVRPHSSGYGIAADPATGAVLEHFGGASASLFAIGHPLRGVSWESSAIPEQVAGATALGAVFPALLANRREVA